MADVSEGAMALFTNEVAQSLDRVAVQHDARIVQGVRLDLGEYSQDFSYILIDRYGILLIDAQIWPGSAIRGNASSATWSAKRTGADNTKFANPLIAGRQRTEVLAEALSTCGKRFSAETFSYLVVFAGSDLSGISLTGVDSGRLVDLPELEDRLNMRFDFAINAGLLEPSEIDDLVSLLKVLDRSSDRAASPASSRRVPKRSPVARVLGQRRRVEVRLSDSAAGIAPTAPRLSVGERYPSVGETAATRRSAFPILLLSVLIGLAVWLFLYDGISVATDRLSSLTSGAMKQTADVPISSEQGGSTMAVRTAEGVLLEAAPDIYGLVFDLGSPNVTYLDGLSTFSWQFVDNRHGYPPGEKRIALTFDAAGDLRGVQVD